MPTPIRSYRLSDEAAAFIQQLANIFGSPDKGVLAIAEILTPEVLAGYAPMTVNKRGAQLPPIATPNPHYQEPEKGGRLETFEPPPPKKAETVAERKRREAREHADALAQADVVARAVGRDDIDYDLENVPHRGILSVGQPRAPVLQPKASYVIQPRKVKPLTRPHGSTEAKRRREQR